MGSDSKLFSTLWKRQGHPGSTWGPLEAAAPPGSRIDPSEAVGIPWKQQAPPGRGKRPHGRGRKPLGAAGILWKQEEFPGSGKDPLEVEGTPGSGRDPLEVAGTH